MTSSSSSASPIDSTSVGDPARFRTFANGQPLLLFGDNLFLDLDISTNGLRGIYLRVVVGGNVACGDAVEVLSRPDAFPD